MQLQQVLQSQASQLELLRQQNHALAREREADAAAAEQCKAQLQAAQQRLAAVQAQANGRAQEVRRAGFAPWLVLEWRCLGCCLLGADTGVLPPGRFPAPAGARAQPDAQGVGQHAAEPGRADSGADGQVLRAAGVMIS